MYNPESNPFDRERLLLCKIVLGDQKAFTELFHQHQAMVCNFEITPSLRVFTKRHYLFPIPSNDVNVDTELIQNPGW